ncbi:erythromycin esterase family protein [Adhaeribacter pallidiroseus]|uniref:Protein-L-isoaspartate(D-aspartate) O-methyltransferase n=1 Tax=Adhaeribacter pallidiroseus TaxID=2072847 RepID=A0A369QWF5_9BACT|nr:erythromycin esterase family protein [Adhaeribacter pallidiroseus]RDC66488.1 Protein-L-isoaspartate(D-aspartate) O-methyltransferase [Adhaeribacter pallidiroseus]
MAKNKLPYYPLENTQSLDVLLDAIGDARFVLLGKASHGTSEYYTWRTAISRRLITEKNFNFIAVEGDWPDCYLVNRFIKGYPEAGTSVHDVLKNFTRWPTWMWGNWEVAALVEWLREHNQNQLIDKKAGFYGLDVYSLWDSLEQIVQYLEQNDGTTVEAAKKAFRCFGPFGDDPQAYAEAIAFVDKGCENEVLEILQKISANAPQFSSDREANFGAEQNALVAVNAEKYYRAMIRSGGSSWNVRDRHMMQTLNRLMTLHGPDAKAIIWEHNTHIGDARATNMARSGMVNIGQLVREEHGRENAFLVGFGSYWGTAMAGRQWGAAMQKMEVPRAKPKSWEAHLHHAGPGDKLLFSEELRELEELQKPIGHRAIGVVYNPEFEAFGNYVPSRLPERYDAFLFIDETEAVYPLHNYRDAHQPPELYPWGT